MTLGGEHHAAVEAELPVPAGPERGDIVVELEVPRSAQDITAAWLSQALGGEPIAAPSLATPRRIGEDLGLMSQLFQVRWEGPRPRPGTVIVKLWDLSDEAGIGELRFYTDLADDVPFRVPRCYAAAVDDAGQRSVLVLEDLSSLEQGDCLIELSPQQAPPFAGTLAALHARWWASPRLAALGWLPEAPASWGGPEWYEPRIERFRARFGARLDPFASALLDDAAEANAIAVDRLAAAESTLLHQDLHLDNVLFAPPSAEPVLLDWSHVAAGPAAIDLAQLLVVMTRPADRGAILDHYLAELARGGVDRTRRDVEGELIAAVMLLFIAWTCGIAHWHPTSDRERRIQQVGIDRALRAAHDLRHAIERLLDHG